MCFGNTTETKKRTVAPFTGAWIEILTCTDLTPEQYKVAPFTGAWIEISDVNAGDLGGWGRALHGRVD